MHRVSLTVGRSTVRTLSVLALWLMWCAVAKSQNISASLPDAPIPTADAQRASTAAIDDIDISWKKLPRRILTDQKNIWLFPTQVARGRYWLPTLAVVGGTAALIATDPKTAPWRTAARRHDDADDQRRFEHLAANDDRGRQHLGGRPYPL